MKKRSLWLCPLAIAAIVALDQWVKAYIVTHFAVGESKPRDSICSQSPLGGGL
mgnify:CR=1 FL=1